MKITRFNWKEVEEMIRAEGVGEVTRHVIDGAVVYSVVIGEGTYELSARLARELFAERLLPHELYAGLVTAGMRRRG